MAKETKEERRARIQEEVAARAEARTKTYFENVEKAKAAAAAQAPELPASDAYNYDYAWRSAVGSRSTDVSGSLNLIKTQNAYYDASTNTIVDPATGERTTATQSMWSGPTTFTGSSSGAGSSGSVVKDPYAGLTPEQIDARKNAEAIAKQYGLSIDPATGMIIKPPANYVIDPVTGKFVDPSKVSKPGKIETRRVTNPDGSITIFYNDGTTATIPARVVTGSGNGFSGSSATGFSSSGAPTGPTLAKDVFKQTLALFFGESELTKGWMDELYNVVSKYYRNGVAVAEALNMSLLDARNNPNLKAFTDRFKGIYALQDLRQAGKPVNVPTIAEYVAAQAGMADILNQAGLGELGSEQFTGELIGKGNSVSSVAEKIANVYQRIDMAPKEIKDVLGRYFPTVDKPTLAKTILLGEKGVTQLVDELNKYDVLAAAEQQGVGALGAKGILGGVTEDRAQNYARLGYSYSEILPKFGQVREVTPTVGKLAGISKAADIGQVGVEQALISGLAQPMETIKKLGEEEIGRFSGKAGRAELGLASQRRANRAF
jgi:hypothetical protein